MFFFFIRVLSHFSQVFVFWTFQTTNKKKEGFNGFQWQSRILKISWIVCGNGRTFTTYSILNHAGAMYLQKVCIYFHLPYSLGKINFKSNSYSLQLMRYLRRLGNRFGSCFCCTKSLILINRLDWRYFIAAQTTNGDFFTASMNYGKNTCCRHRLYIMSTEVCCFRIDCSSFVVRMFFFTIKCPQFAG